MSRTFKDRPDWVKKNDPAYRPFIDHDHRTGECVEETFDDMRRWAGGQNYSMARNHFLKCKKIIRTTWYCDRKEPHVNSYGRQTCWNVIYDYTNNFLWGIRPCRGHVELSDAPDEPCSCDRHPEPIRNTCRIDLPRSIGLGEIYNNRTSRTKEINLFFTRPTRSRVRNDMRGLINDFNTNGDLSDENEDYNGSWEKNIPWWD